MNETTATDPKAEDPVLNPKRRSHDRQYWDDRLKRYVDFETPAEVQRPSRVGPNRHKRRMAKSPERAKLGAYKPPSDDERRMVRNRRKAVARRRAGR